MECALRKQSKLRREKKERAESIERWRANRLRDAQIEVARLEAEKLRLELEALRKPPPPREPTWVVDHTAGTEKVIAEIEHADGVFELTDHRGVLGQTCLVLCVSETDRGHQTGVDRVIFSMTAGEVVGLARKLLTAMGAE